MKQTLTILRGLPASGKSTWAKEKIKEGSTLRVCRDDIRNMLIPDYSFNGEIDECLVTEIENSSIKEALIYGYDVIVDATNFRGHERFIELMPKEEDIDLVIKEFNVSLEECIKRDKKREKPTGIKVILGMYNHYIKDK